MGARDNEVGITRGSDIDAALKAGELIERHRTGPKESDIPHALPYVILRDANGDESVEYVDNVQKAPPNRNGTVQLKDGPSFISYFNAHATEHSAIYATINPCRFLAVLDEHPAAQANDPAWREFRAAFAPELSPEWTTWTAQHKKAFESTEEFAYFIENNAPDFVNPDAATMLEMALNFRVTSSAQYKAVQRLQDGNVELQYVNVVEGQATARGGAVKIPEEFEISVPLFAGPAEVPRQVHARLRYRLGAGGVKLWYELIRPHKVLEAGFKQLFTDISDGTKRTVLLGQSD